MDNKRGRVEHRHGQSSQDGGREYQKWTLDNLVMNRAKKTRQALKGLEYMLKKHVFNNAHP